MRDTRTALTRIGDLGELTLQAPSDGILIR
jgi:hypothetical protein